MNYTLPKNVIISLGLVTFSSHVSVAAPPVSASITGDAVSGSRIYIVDPASTSNPQKLMVTSDSTQLVNALAGDASFAGGNVELYTAGDSASLTDFANAQRVELNINLGGGNQVTVSSLNGQDWFNSSTTGYDTSWGANNLANQWFNDFVDELDSFSSLVSFTADRASLFDEFRDNGGFQQQSDPNISYVDISGDTVTLGLGGFIDIGPRVATLVAGATGFPVATVAGFIPGGIQSSEVVLIDGVASYSFDGITSGVCLDDGMDSYNAIYEVTQTVPEPSSAMLVLAGAGALTLRRKR